MKLYNFDNLIVVFGCYMMMLLALLAGAGTYEAIRLIIFGA